MYGISRPEWQKPINYTYQAKICQEYLFHFPTFLTVGETLHYLIIFMNQLYVFHCATQLAFTETIVTNARWLKVETERSQGTIFNNIF